MTARRTATGLPPLLAALLNPACYPHPVRRVRLIETHISWVLLTGDWAYKIKKPVDLGFVDFSTLTLRHHYCNEELRLNRRLAPELYDSVVTIGGTALAPRVGAPGRALEYAVRMREFPQRTLADHCLARGAFGAPAIDRLALDIAAFHAAVPAAPKRSRCGTLRTVFATALQNFDQLRPRVTSARAKARLTRLRRWTRAEHAARRAALAARRHDGFVRECHGDLHLGNIVMLDQQPRAFDCIEFNPALRWIDVMSEVAFLLMDLEDHGRPALAARFLNRYLEATGDYEGLAVLRGYLVYRALVRAKVNALRSRQPHLASHGKFRLRQLVSEYLELAEDYTRPHPPALVIAHGFSGSGKTTATQALIELTGAVRIRSDIERKRLFGIAPLRHSGSGADAGIYTPVANTATYARLGDIARGILAAGWPVVVDAAFLKRAERDAFRRLAAEQGVPFAILDFSAPPGVLAARVCARTAGGNDASEADLAVLGRQRATHEPLDRDELPVTFAIDTRRPVTPRTWRPLLARVLSPLLI